MPVFFCDHCGAEVSPHSSRCPRCGRFFSGIKCPRCGFEGDAENFTSGCPSCGYLTLTANRQKKTDLEADRGKVPSPWIFRVLGLVLFLIILVLLFLLLKR